MLFELIQCLSIGFFIFLDSKTKFVPRMNQNLKKIINNLFVYDFLIKLSILNINLCFLIFVISKITV